MEVNCKVVRQTGILTRWFLLFLSITAKLEVMLTLSKDIIETIIHRLVDEFSPDKIYLFGSHAWGKPGPDSDVDLMVIVPHSDLKPALRATRAYIRLADLRIPKDILVKTHAEFEKYADVKASLEAKILKEGRVIYERR